MHSSEKRRDQLIPVQKWLSSELVSILLDMNMIIIMASHMFHNRQNQLENTFFPITAQC